MNYWDSIIEGLITSGLLGLILFATKDLIRNWINKPYEEEMGKFQNNLDKDLAEYSGNIDKELTEFSTNLDQVKEQINYKFTIYHQKQVEAMGELHSKIYFSLMYLARVTEEKNQNLNDIKEIYEKGITELNEAKAVLYGASIFIDDSFFYRFENMTLQLMQGFHHLRHSYRNNESINFADLSQKIQIVNNELIMIKREIRSVLKVEPIM